jgi:3D (Asp-Asp-Asp) domain-containing protein
MMTFIINILLALGINLHLGYFSVSGYCNESGASPYQGLTASGQYTRQGIVACGPSFPFGTRFLIKGKWYECQDRGSEITDDHLDIWFPTREEAIEWGRRELLVQFLLPDE